MHPRTKSRAGAKTEKPDKQCLQKRNIEALLPCGVEACFTVFNTFTSIGHGSEGFNFFNLARPSYISVRSGEQTKKQFVMPIKIHFFFFLWIDDREVKRVLCSKTYV